jgi:glucokinase
MKDRAMGIDIGGTNTAFGLVDRAGTVYGAGKIPTPRYPDADEYVRELAAALRPSIEAAGGEGRIAGIGIGAPNADAPLGTIENAPNLPWKGSMPLVEKLQAHFPRIPVRLINDAKAAALGEMVYGAARGMRDFLVVTLGTGLGSGFVVNGHLMTGRYGMAGELGHVTLDPEGRVCGCGRRGCAETYASATGIRRTVFELLADRTEASEFRTIAYDDLTAETIARAARRGDPLALEAFEYTGRQLARALAGAVMISGPEAVFLFGGLAGATDLIFEPTRKYLEMFLHENFRGKVALLPSGVAQGNAAILGAAALVWSRQP